MRVEEVLTSMTARSSRRLSLPSLLTSALANKSSALSSALGCSMVEASPKAKIDPSLPPTLMYPSVRIDLAARSRR